MTLYTDKKYYINDALIERLDFLIHRQKKAWDNLLIVDGDEGDGKSTAAIGWAYYLAWKTGTPFSVDNVFFDVRELARFATQTERRVIVWDEAALGGMGQDHLSKIQKQLIKILMIGRKKGHFWIFVIPKVRQLKSYFVMERAVGLIHVFTPDGLTRGSFAFFRRDKLRKLYITSLKTKMPNYRYYKSFLGKYVEKGFVISKEKYEAKKDEAIRKTAERLGKGDFDKNLIRLKQLQHHIAIHPNFTNKQKAEIAGVTPRSVTSWKKISPHDLEEEDFVARAGVEKETRSKISMIWDKTAPKPDQTPGPPPSTQANNGRKEPKEEA